jgi:hypothetical protein
MKEWILTSEVEPPNNMTVLAESCGSLFSAAYSKLLDQWYLVNGSYMEEIAEPQKLFLDPEYAKSHPRKSPVIHTEKPRLRRRKTEQMEFLL